MKVSLVSSLAFLALTLAPIQILHAEEAVMAGFGKAKLNTLLQAWVLNEDDAPNNADSNVRLRRAEIKLSGSVHEKTRYFVMIDAAKAPAMTATGDNKVLQDFGIAFMPIENFEIIVGQFKIPTLAEGFNPSSELMLPERSYISRTYGDRRETGLLLDYKFDPIRVRLMGSNGQVTPGAATTNVNDTDSSKDVNGRVDWAIMEGLKIGAFGSNSQSMAGNSTRWGGDAEFTWGHLVVRVSGLAAKELSIDKNGMSAEAGYHLADNLQAAARYENFQITSGTESSANATTLGLNYFLEGHNLKIQLAQSFMHNMSSATGGTPATYVDGSYKAIAGDKGESLTILAFQAAM